MKYHFSSLRFFPFFWNFLFFRSFPLKLCPERQLLPLFITSFQVMLKGKIEVKLFSVWKLRKPFLNPLLYWMLDVVCLRNYIHDAHEWFIYSGLNNCTNRIRRIISLNLFVQLRYASGNKIWFFLSLIFGFLSQKVYFKYLFKSYWVSKP